MRQNNACTFVQSPYNSSNVSNRTGACHRFPAVVIKTQCLNNTYRETFENYEPKTTKAKALPDNVL